MAITTLTIRHIRKRSNPLADHEAALEANVVLLDCLYRLSFTADKLTAPQVDELVNILSRRTGEIEVLLKRIAYAHTHPPREP